MSDFVRYMETFNSKDREKEKAENYLELLHMIKSELMKLHELNQPHSVGGGSLTLVAEKEKP
jgi:hypothetical protein